MDKILCPTFWKYLNCFSFQIEREGYFIGGPVAPTLNIMANSNRKRHVYLELTVKDVENYEDDFLFERNGADSGSDKAAA